MRHCISIAAVMLLGGMPVQAQENVQYNRDVRPILSDKCFNCHGPDSAKRKGDLRLDVEKDAVADRGDYFVIAPGRPNKSVLLERVLEKDPKKRMPPALTGVGLTPREVETLRKWITQGAKFEKHWSLIPPVKAALPAVKNKQWPRNAIDHFVLARLEKEGLEPSPEADRTTLIRRLTLDLTGLPPTPAEVDAFLEDKTPEAYEKLVDRLLSSPRYGERLAKPWLDAARYADTNGYQTDGERIMWRWRDWVIAAFNDNMPFDRFTVEQLAGDLLPNATLEQRMATGFNRNHRGNAEGGVIPEEFAVEYVVDRLDTTFTVWLGLTIGCARCHSHKYDPLTQTEFYQLFAYFNNVPERGKAIRIGNSPPYLRTPTPEQEIMLKLLESQFHAARFTWDKLQPAVHEAQQAWEKTTNMTSDWTYTRGLQARFPADDTLISLEQTNGIRRPGKNSPAMIFPAATEQKLPLEMGDYGLFDKFTLAAWIHPTAKGGPIITRMENESGRALGLSVVYENGKVHVNIVVRWLDDAIRVVTEEAFPPGRWHHVLVSYDGSGKAKGIRVYVDGSPARLKVNLDDLNSTFKNKEPTRIGAGGGKRFHGAIDDVRIYDHVVEAEDAAIVATSDPIQAILEIPEKRRTPAQASKLRICFLETYAPGDLRRPYRKLAEARRELAGFEEALPTTMVMAEMPTPRTTHFLIRGEYDKHGPVVKPGLPLALPPLPPGAGNNRLGLAKWLVHSDNPLTARVTVNRFWQMLFGIGLVKTVEDFGSQGEWPSHPELLDWLAVEFQNPVRGASVSARSSWDVKRLLKTIVMSATYRQSSRNRADLQARDPENRLLARGPRVRLSAEMIRDQALFVSGLLVERVGGPSVHPYQPKGIVQELGGTEEPKQDHGPNLYRRSLYTFWKRTVPPPAMMTFDAANRETCVVRQSRTNTPLQALNLLNDVTFIEAARVLAERVMLEGGSTPQSRLTLAFRLTTGRMPSPAELDILARGFEDHHRKYAADRAAALKLVSAGESPRDESLDVAQLAAYTALANVLLNLDEVITKE